MDLVYIITALFCLYIIIGSLSSCTVVTTDVSSEAQKTAMVYYYLPETVIKIHVTAKVAVLYAGDPARLTGSSKVLEEAFSVTTANIADPTIMYAIQYQRNVLMSDDVKFGVNEKGLLETANISTDDRTAAIIDSLTNAPKLIFANSTQGETKADGTIVIKIKEYTTDFEIKASDVKKTETTIPWKILISNEVNNASQTKLLTADFVYSSDNPLGENYRIANSSSDSSEKISGIITRPLRQLRLKLNSSLTDLEADSPAINLIVADPSKEVIIPVRRSAFVKRTNDITIKEGVVTSNQIKNPSSVEGAIAIPISIAKAIVSIPAQIVQFKIDNTKRNDALIKATAALEQSKLESEKTELTRNSEIEKVKLSIDSSNLSNSIELQKTKLALDAEMFKAETDRLKALQDLQKQIVAIKTASTPPQPQKS